MIRLKRAAACLVAAVWACLAGAAEPSPPLRISRDGIQAELSVNDANAELRWQFTRPPSHPIDQITATVNDRPLGVPTISPYPAPGHVTAAIALLDVSGLQRRDQIERFKMAMLLLAGRKAVHDQVAFAVYALEGSLLVPTSDDPGETLALLAQVPPLDEEANLSGALISAMRTLEKLPADRRAIYVLTDGHNDSPIALASLAELAHATGVTLFFLLAPGDRAVDLPALRALAEASGGQLVEDKDLATFLGEPFALLDSGAQLQFPLAAARRFFWEPQANLAVVIHYGDKQLALNSTAAVANAAPGETAVYAWQRYPAAVAAAGGLGLLALGGLGWLGFRRPRSGRLRVEPAQAAGAIAAIEDVTSGAVYPLKHPLMRIGRSSDNDIVLDEATVGRAHAIIQQVGAHSFSITDQASANGTLVNQQQIDTAKLKDGDLISIGATTLRFVAGGAGATQPTRVK
jgi:hypothetical protein